MIDVKKAPFNLSEEQEKWVYGKLNSLTDKEKAGQLFCVLGTIFDKETLYKFTHEYCIGGILFRPEPCGVINRKYAEAEKDIKVPLLKAANLEEGGIGAISDGTFYGTQMQVAATDNTAYAKTFGKFCAEEGRSCGVNWTFSPVCDIDYNFRNPITNVRTFGSNPARVKKMTKAYVDTVQKYGVAACAKHFPGDGVDFRDQHLHPTINSLSAKKWYATYGAIYKNLIDGGLLSIMVGHIKQPAVEQDICPTLEYKDCLPASLSKHLITGVLREKYGFNGVITTDATIMGGYTMPMERRLALPATINAGIDMIVSKTFVLRLVLRKSQAFYDAKWDPSSYWNMSTEENAPNGGYLTPKKIKVTVTDEDGKETEKEIEKLPSVDEKRFKVRWAQNGGSYVFDEIKEKVTDEQGNETEKIVGYLPVLQIAAVNTEDWISVSMTGCMGITSPVKIAAVFTQAEK